MGYVVTGLTMARASALKHATANLTPAVLAQIINEAIDSELAAGRLCECENCSCSTPDAEAQVEAPAEPEHTDRHYDDEADDQGYGAAFSQ